MASVKGIVRDANGAPLNGALVRLHRLDTGAMLGEATSAVVVTGDALESLVELRLNLNSDFFDTSQYARPMTVAAEIVASAGAIGGYAARCEGGNFFRQDAATLTGAPITGRFCMEFRFMATGFQQETVLASYNSGTSYIMFRMLTNGSIALDVNGYYNYPTVRTISSAAGSIVAGQYHWASLTCNAAGDLVLFIDGAPVGTKVTGTPSPVSVPNTAYWAFGSATNTTIYYDQARATVGDERYPAAGYAVPTSEFLPGVTSPPGRYEIATDYTGESYAVAIAPTGGANPVQNHLIHRVIPA